MEHGMVWYGGMAASASSVVVFCVGVCVFVPVVGRKGWKVEKCTL